ncbi:MAG: hypothetical protein AB7W44_09530 [Pyrinomonadaceae bacterium]
MEDPAFGRRVGKVAGFELALAFDLHAFPKPPGHSRFDPVE